MKRLPVILFALSVMLCAACQTYTMSNGKKLRQVFPVKDHIYPNEVDTARFIVQHFSLDDYTNRATQRNGKRLVEGIRGRDISELLNTGDRYYVYFWDVTCPASAPDIHKLDSLAGSGEQVLIVSLQRRFEDIDVLLGKTVFAQYPYYIIENKEYTDVILRRQRDFIKEACSSCYDKQKDDLVYTEYLLLEKVNVKPVMGNSVDNILR